MQRISEKDIRILELTTAIKIAVSNSDERTRDLVFHLVDQIRKAIDGGDV